MTDILFIGDKNFTDVFDSFGLSTLKVNSCQEICAALKDKTANIGLVCLQRKFAAALDFLDVPNVILLSEKFDKKDIIEDFRRISEKATGVDLTSKL